MEHNKQQPGLIHYVLLGMCLGFGISSAVLGIVIVVKENNANDGNVHLVRLRRAIEEDSPVTTGAPSVHTGHIDVITKGRSEQLFSEDVNFLSSSTETATDDKIQVVLLTQSKNTLLYSDAIGKTWGSGLPHVKYVPAKDQHQLYGYQHQVQSLRTACNLQRREASSWLVLATEAVYINTPALRAVLNRLSPSDPILIGKTLTHYSYLLHSPNS